MTPDEFRAARETLDLTQAELARAFGVTVRTVVAWEMGYRGKKPSPIPRAIAVLAQLALKQPSARLALGIPSKGKIATARKSARPDDEGATIETD